jgi:hypothetical protein
MGLVIGLGVRLLPAVGIYLLRGGGVAGWTLALVVVICVIMVLVENYAGYLGGAYRANEYNPTVADPIRARLNQLVPLRVGVWLAYAVALVLMGVV